MTKDANPKIILVLRHGVRIGPRFGAGLPTRGSSLFAQAALGAGLAGPAGVLLGRFWMSGETALDLPKIPVFAVARARTVHRSPVRNNHGEGCSIGSLRTARRVSSGPLMIYD